MLLQRGEDCREYLSWVRDLISLFMFTGNPVALTLDLTIRSVILQRQPEIWPSKLPPSSRQLPLAALAFFACMGGCRTSSSIERLGMAWISSSGLLVGFSTTLNAETSNSTRSSS